MTLTELFNKYGSDKDQRNQYGAFYDCLLAPMKESATAVLEVGVFNGASLRAWRDYFPHASILGLDVHPTYMVREKRIETRLVNSTETDEVDLHLGHRLGSACYDLIVDDGSHLLRHQLQTLANLWPYLKPGGVYVIEDIIDPRFAERLSFIGNAVLVDNREKTGVMGAVLMAIRKGK